MDELRMNTFSCETCRGFSTLEILIAMTVLVLAISAVLLLNPPAPAGSVGIELSGVAHDLAQTALTHEEVLAHQDFKLVVASTSVETVDGVEYTKRITVLPTDYFTKRVTATVSWGGKYYHGARITLSTLITNSQDSVAGDTCNSSLSGNWSFPHITSALFGALTGLDDPGGTYPLTDIDVYRGRLYATVNENVSPLPSLGPNNAGTASVDSAVGSVPWANIGNIGTSDNRYSTAVLGSGGVTNYIHADNFGFQIPNGATILGIEVDVERKNSSNTNTVKDKDVRILRSDRSIGFLNKAHAQNWPTADAYDSYGSSNDLWNETSWSAEAINSPTFGVVVNTFAAAGSGSRTASVDHVRITVTYTKQFYVVSVSGTSNLVGGLGENTVSTGMNAVIVATSTATGSHAYVAMNSGSTQFEVIDVSVKTPVVVATYHVPGASVVAKSVYYKDGYVYLGLANNPSGAELYVIDVHVHTSPVLVGVYEMGAGINAMYVKNGIAYLATDDTNQELVRLDVRDLAHPVFMGKYDAPGTVGSGQARSIYVVGETLYLGRYYSLTLAPEFAILVDSPAPTLRGSFDVGPSGTHPFGIYGIIVRDTLAFLLTASPSNGGAVQIFDLSNIGTPSLYSSVTLPNNGAGVSLDCEGDTMYAASVPINGAHTNKGSLSRITAL